MPRKRDQPHWLDSTTKIWRVRRGVVLDRAKWSRASRPRARTVPMENRKRSSDSTPCGCQDPCKAGAAGSGPFKEPEHSSRGAIRPLVARELYASQWRDGSSPRRAWAASRSGTRRVAHVSLCPPSIVKHAAGHFGRGKSPRIANFREVDGEAGRSRARSAPERAAIPIAALTCGLGGSCRQLRARRPCAASAAPSLEQWGLRDSSWTN